MSTYLPQCIESIARQLQDNWELILVNDGSTDDSLSICQTFAEGRDNVRIIDKPNGGLSDARNAGTFIAAGEWIYYIDSDDWLADGAISTLLNFAISNKCDVVQGGLYYTYNTHLLYDSRLPVKNVLDNKEAMRELVINDTVKNFAWGKLYRATLIKDILFPKGLFFEDSYWQHFVMQRVQRYGIVAKPLYYYRQRESGISGEFSLRNLHLAEGYEQRLCFIQANYPELTGLMANCLWNTIFSLAQRGRLTPNREVRQKYETYYEYAIGRYSQIFDKWLKTNPIWRFRNSPRVLCIILFIKRIWNHFFTSRYYIAITK
ncbi:MAG: glycosyltransferase [Bacteroidaceae bacterium]|nr:glycosyltransferase [Bacteroidaceae bacterium]